MLSRNSIMHDQPCRLVALGESSLQINGEGWFGLAAGNEQSDANLAAAGEMNMNTASADVGQVLNSLAGPAWHRRIIGVITPHALSYLPTLHAGKPEDAPEPAAFAVPQWIATKHLVAPIQY